MQSQGISNAEVKACVPGLAKEEKVKGKPLTVTIYVGGKQVDTLTDDQRKRMEDKLSETMSIYYTAHVEEYKKIQ